MARVQTLGAAPGEDFLKTIVSIFSEIEEKGYKKKKTRRDIVCQICEFLDKCRGTTVARARAGFCIKLPDGYRVLTTIGIPPKDLILTKACKTRLERSGSTEALINEFRAQIKKTVPMLTHPDMKHQASSSPEPFIGGRHRTSGPVGRKRTPKRPIIKSESEDEASGEEKEDTEQVPGVCGRMVVTMKVSTQALTTLSKQTSAQEGKVITTDKEHDVPQSVQQVLEDGAALPNTQLPTPPAPVLSAPEEDTLMGDVSTSAPDAVQVAFHGSRETLLYDMHTLIVHILGGNVANLQDRDALVRHLNTDLKAPRVYLADAFYASEPLRRLMGLEAHSAEKLSCIDPASWAGYLAELRALCCSPTYAQMDYHQRLTEVVHIVYLPEELYAVAQLGWDRLQDVAMLCSLIAEITGPEDEILPEDIKNQWITGKKKDNAFLRKLMAASRRVDAFPLDKE